MDMDLEMPPLAAMHKEKLTQALLETCKPEWALSPGFCLKQQQSSIFAVREMSSKCRSVDKCPSLSGWLRPTQEQTLAELRDVVHIYSFTKHPET